MTHAVSPAQAGRWYRDARPELPNRGRGSRGKADGGRRPWAREAAGRRRAMAS